MCVSHFWLKMLLKWKPIFLLWTELIIRNLNYNNHRNGSYNIDILHLIRFCTREIFLCINWAFNCNSTEGTFGIAGCALRPAPCALLEHSASLLTATEHQDQPLKTVWLKNCHFNFSGFHFKFFFNSVVTLSMA